MPKILPQIQNIVVVMFENRSLDNLCGWLYSNPTPQPSLYLPAGSPSCFNGLNPSCWNPSNPDYFTGAAPNRVSVVPGTTGFLIPDPDPEETFENVTYQLYGPQGAVPNPKWPNQGFVVNYEKRGSSNTNQIMETYTAAQVPVLSALAQNYAISDAWFCSVPSQTLANRAFVHSGTSNGEVNNGILPDPFDFDAPTIFNVLQKIGASWKVYSNTEITPSLTRTFAPRLWDSKFDPNFARVTAFEQDCANSSLPQYSFIEPSFLVNPNDQHPPHDVGAGEQFLYRIWQAVSQSPAWNNILLVITYDEHGGCYDHVLPPWGAAPPQTRFGEWIRAVRRFFCRIWCFFAGCTCPNFQFDRFGLRVPAVVVSPYIQAGTVFRSNTSTPYDHTSILATLRDWLQIPAADMLSSKRIAAAPTLDQVLTLAAPRMAKPVIPPPRIAPTIAPPPTLPSPDEMPLNDLQKSLVSGFARRSGQNRGLAVKQTPNRGRAIAHFTQRKEMVSKDK
ncbi:MAG TPA: alkaline phosphatase family protein [Candidatus Dormibacteraeota bacterium]|nr:alkaline phosphatase family protein [Candidatus Dormibacteraeota bacterium]